MNFKCVVIIVLHAVLHMCFGTVILDHNSQSAEADTFICGGEATFTCNIVPAPNGMSWIKSTGLLTNCQGTADNCVNPVKDNYQFSSNVSINQFYMKINPVKLTDETTFTCNDGAGVDDTKMISVAIIPRSISFTETGSGNVELQATTDCVYPLSSVSIEWYYTEDIGGTPEVYNGFSPEESDDNSSCTSGDCASGAGVSHFTSLVKFKENSEYIDVYLFAKVKHSAAPVNEPEVNATTSKKYRILKGPKPGPFCWCCLIPLVVVLLYFVGIIIGGFLTKTSCCCKGFYDCKDSDCECSQGCGKNKCVTCKCCASLPCCNIPELPFWVQVLWCTVIGIPVALGIYTVLKCCGRGNGNVDAKCEDTKPGQKKPDTKNKSKVSAQTENEQHNQGRKPREQPAIPLVAQTTETPMSGREDSDSAVSREHVKLQDSDRTLPLRPMPDIPRKSDRQGHDSKGRGLSANFSDDDHPLVSIDIPLQKKGALDALPEGTGGEEPVKKKKKKKKKQEEDEE